MIFCTHQGKCMPNVPPMVAEPGLFQLASTVKHCILAAS